MAAPAPLTARLPRIDPAVADARRRLLDGLAGAELVDADGTVLTLDAEVVETSRAGDGWIAFATAAGISALKIRLCDGLAVPDWADLFRAMDALGRLEPLIAAMEQATGLAFDPVDLGRGPPDGGTVVRIDAVAADGRIAFELDWSLPPDVTVSWPGAKARAWPASLRALIVVRCALVLPGPAVPAGILAGLRAGDVLLLPATFAQAWTAELYAPAPVGRLVARFSNAPNPSVPATNGSPMMDDTPHADPSPAAPDNTNGAAEAETPTAAAAPAPADLEAWSALPVQVRVMLDDLSLPLDDLMALRAGSVVPLPGGGASLPVRLVAGQAPVAHGDLVAVGDGYGVLIRQRLDPAAPDHDA